MSDTWNFTWTGPGISTTTGKRTNQTDSTPTPTYNIGDANLSKTGQIVTMIPAHTNAKYKMPAWELNIYASPNMPFTTSDNLQAIKNGMYNPDQNYFFPVDLHTSTGTLSNTFYLFLNTQGFFSGLFISQEAIKHYPLHERKFLSDYWDPSTEKKVPSNTSLQYVVNGETIDSSWYVITSLENAVITLPDGKIQYTSSGTTVTNPVITNAPGPIDTNQRLYNRLLNENKQINEYIALIKTQQHTDIQKAQYETPKIQKMSLIYFILYYLYYILLFIMCFYMFMVNVTWDISVKICITILFILYPLTITTIEYYMYKYGSMLYSYTVGAPIGGSPVERNIKNISMIERPYNGIVPLSSN